MKPRAAQVFCAFGAAAVLKSLGFFAKHMAGARGSRSAESIHRMRVSARRLGTAISASEGCFPDRRMARWNREIRAARRALGEARDTDVQIDLAAGFLKNLRSARARPGVERLLLRLGQRRRKLRKDVAATLDRLRKRRVLEKLGAAAAGILRRAPDGCDYVTLGESDRVPPGGSDRKAAAALRRRGARQVRAHLKDLLKLEACACHPRRIDEHHAMRIAAKRLRYIMELYEPVYGKSLSPAVKAARTLQDMLGELHDCDVWVEWLPRFLRKERRRADDARPMREIEPGIRRLMNDRRRRRDRLFRRFAAFWKKLRRKRVWEQVEESLTTNNEC